MITLREDQDKTLSKLRTAMRTSSSVLVYAPTGFGKTVLAAAIILRLMQAKKRVIFCVHRLALIKQTVVTFDGFGIFHGLIVAGCRARPGALVYVASIDTLKGRLGQHPADYLFIDEAHLAASEGWSRTINHYRSTGCRIIGLSGSPERLDGRPLGDCFDSLVDGPSPAWLIKHGYLSTYRAFGPRLIDPAQLRRKGSDYSQADMDEMLGEKVVVEGAINQWATHAHGKRTILFAHSVAAAKRIAEDFTQAGYPFAALDGSTPQWERDNAFLALADRKIMGIANCNLFSEGFDMSAQVGRDVPIEAVVDLYPTDSLARHLQKHGRGLRRKPEPAILLDMVNGFRRLGLPDEERTWSLDGSQKKKTTKEQEETVTICEQCFAAFEPAPRCPHCGWGRPVKERKVETVDVEMEELDIEAMKRKRVQEQGQAKSLQDLIAIATSRGYKSPAKWAAHVWTAREAKQRRKDASDTNMPLLRSGRTNRDL